MLKWRRKSFLDYTPLHRAARDNSRPAVIEALVAVAAGADVAARNEDGWTPLHAAASGPVTGYPDDISAVIEALVAAGADVAARSNSGAPPLHIAASSSVGQAAVISTSTGVG